MTTTRLKVDPDEVLRALGALYDPGDVIELRVPKTGRWGTISGYFNDHLKLVDAIVAIDRRLGIPGIYWSLNPVDPALLARAENRIVERGLCGRVAPSGGG